jgi:hypothetical protein
MSLMFEIIILAEVLVLIILSILIFVLYRLVKNLRGSFSKLGYILRKDSEKYFKDASDKAVKMYCGVSKEEQKVMKKALDQVIKEENETLKEIIFQTQKRSSEIISEAQDEADNIIKKSKNKSEKLLKQVPSKAAEATSWALAKFINEEYSQKDHQKMIEELVEINLKENDEI